MCRWVFTLDGYKLLMEVFSIFWAIRRLTSELLSQNDGLSREITLQIWRS